MRRIIEVYTTITVMTMAAFSQSTSNVDSYVDTAGMLRWKGTNEEVSLFGVNYTTPFAYAYRAHKKLGLSMKKAIDLDVAHMARLGFDAYRVHVWDREVSDENGNLLKNEHLDLFDYLLARLADRGIKMILTPIAWWGTGYPEPDEKTKGFSQGYSKLELIMSSKARAAQRNYLRQFIEHRNPYRRISYKNDPSIIGLEIINEPHHPDSEQATTDYINEMAQTLRHAAFVKPIFYNISQNWSEVQANAVAKSNVDGVSFQWYPTSLVHASTLRGNYLLNVNRYSIPSDNVTGYGKKAKMVYEFDAADVADSYMYPAMARSFREAGMQFAAMFSYEPVQIAWSNTEYPTHFVNLLYAPSKALSLMIAAKAFRQLPRMKSYGEYPNNNRFGDFRVSYEENLSEMNSFDEFAYSNTTRSQPKDLRSLKHVSGCGNSSVVQYDGTGAYFLDKLQDGIWRLEVYPDVLWLRDPFGVASMSRQVARLFWREREIRLFLPDLGHNYAMYSLSGTKKHANGTVESAHLIKPGIYLVTATGGDERAVKKYLSKKEIFLEGLYIPPPTSPDIYVVNRTSPYAVESSRPEFTFQIGSERNITNANLYIRRLGWRGFAKHTLKNTAGFQYALIDTLKIMQSGKLEYCVSVEIGDKTYTFPEGIEQTPGTWDFSTTALWEMKVAKPGEPIILLDALRDRKNFIFPHFSRSMRYSLDYTNGSNSEETAMTLKVTFGGADETPFGLQLNVSDFVKAFEVQLESYHSIVLKARATQDSACVVGVSLLMTDGTSYGADVQITNNWQAIKIPLSAFRRTNALILPDSYPLFLPKVWDNTSTPGNNLLGLHLLQHVQIVVNPANAKVRSDTQEIGLQISSLGLAQ